MLHNSILCELYGFTFVYTNHTTKQAHLVDAASSPSPKLGGGPPFEGWVAAATGVGVVEEVVMLLEMGGVEGEGGEDGVGSERFRSS